MSRITRREFINGALVMTGAGLLPGAARTSAMAQLAPDYYPPALTGLRGSHPESNTAAHERAWTRRTDWGPTTQVDTLYDLVIVGAGISGLSAAYFYQRAFGNEKKILILDNHDDFGGHARRNEHRPNGRLRFGHGGSQTLVQPYNSSESAQAMLADIGINLYDFKAAYDLEFYQRHNLSAVTYFNKPVFGVDRVVKHPFCNYYNYVEGLPGAQVSPEQAARQAPVGRRGQQQLLKVLQGGIHKLIVAPESLEAYLYSHSYFDYLQHTLGVDDPLVLRMARNSGLDWGLGGTDIMSIGEARDCGALGFAPVASFDEANPYIHHFPDGNASLVRALVKHLIPDVAEGADVQAQLLARFHYDRLDQPDNTVRIRLNSTAVDISHVGDPRSADAVRVKYVGSGTAQEVRSRHLVLAGYNMMIPHIVTDLPGDQAEALAQQDKSPLVYTTVGMKNWQAVKAAGIGLAMCPGNRHQAVFMDFPVSMGGYAYTRSPDEPCVLQLISCPYGDVYGAPAAEQFAEARYRMLAERFSDYESELREHFAGMLSGTGFDFDADVSSITVNRWAHGYTIPGPGDSLEVGRRPFGRITVANCDSEGGADVFLAVNAAQRAVNELPG